MSTGRRGARARSSSRGRNKRPSDIEKKPDVQAQSKEDSPTKQGARSSSRGGRRRDSAADLGMAGPPPGTNSTGQRRRSSSRGRRSTTTVKGPARVTDERSSSEVPKRPSSSFDEDLLSSKDISADIPPQELAPDVPKLGVPKVETSKLSLDDSFSPAMMDSTTEKKMPDSSSTERRVGRERSSSRGRRKRPPDIEEKPDEEANSKEDSPIRTRARSSSRGGRRRDSAADLGTAAPSPRETSSDQGRRSVSRGRRRALSKDPGKRHATEDNTDLNTVRTRSNSRGRRRASLASKEDSALSSDSTHSSRLRSTSLDVIRRNAANNPLSSSKRQLGQSSHDASKNMLSSMSLHGNLEAKSWGSLQDSFSSLGASESGRSGAGSRSGRPSRRMPKRMATQDKSMNSSLHEAAKGLSETKIQASCGFLCADLRKRFRSDFPGAKDMPTDDELKERYRNAQSIASQTAPSQTAPTDTGTSEPPKDIKDEEDEEALEATTEKPKINYSDKLMAATKGKPASFTMSSKAVRKPQAISENTLDPFKTDPQKAEVAQKTSRKGPRLKELVQSVSLKFASKNSAIDNDDGSVDSSELRADPADALFKMTSTLNFDKALWNEPSGGSKGKKDKRSGSRPRSGREKEGETPPKKDTTKQHNMPGDINTTTGADSIVAKASKKSKGKGSLKGGAINTNDDVSKSQHSASGRRISFMSRKSVANNMPDGDDNSCENARQSSKFDDMLPVLKERKAR